MVETESDDILANADTEDISFLVVGDPFGYVVHHDGCMRVFKLIIPLHTLTELPLMPISSYEQKPFLSLPQ